MSRKRSQPDLISAVIMDSVTERSYFSEAQIYTKIYILKDLDPRQCRKARRDEVIKCQRGSKEKEVLWGWVAREGSKKELRHEQDLQKRGRREWGGAFQEGGTV